MKSRKKIKNSHFDRFCLQVWTRKYKSTWLLKNTKLFLIGRFFKFLFCIKHIKGVTIDVRLWNFKNRIIFGRYPTLNKFQNWLCKIFGDFTLGEALAESSGGLGRMLAWAWGEAGRSLSGRLAEAIIPTDTPCLEDASSNPAVRELNTPTDTPL